MDFNKLKHSIAAGQFRLFIEEALVDDPKLFSRSFWVRPGNRVPLLNYLIGLHGAKADLHQEIEFLISKGANLNDFHSVHLALKLGKTDLAELFLSNRQTAINVNDKDDDNRTLISYAIENKKQGIIDLLAARQANCFIPSRYRDFTQITPFYQAILDDYPEALSRLPSDASEPLGTQRFTAFVMAARYHSLKALEGLLQMVPPGLNGRWTELDAEDSDGQRAIDYLCESLARKYQPDTLAAIGQLLCHGATAPRSEKHCVLLREYNKQLLECVVRYTADKPQQAANFLRAARCKQNSLHEIMFAQRVWYRQILNFFAAYSDIAYKLQQLVKPEHQAIFTREEYQFAIFAGKHKKRYEAEIFNRPWGAMRSNLANGRITSWEQVERYCKKTSSRSAGIFERMRGSAAVHLDHNMPDDDENRLSTGPD